MTFSKAQQTKIIRNSHYLLFYTKEKFEAPKKEMVFRGLTAYRRSCMKPLIELVLHRQMKSHTW